MTTTPEDRIRAEFKRGKKHWHRQGLPISQFYLQLARRWKRPIREIKEIVKNTGPRYTHTNDTDIYVGRFGNIDGYARLIGKGKKDTYQIILRRGNGFAATAYMTYRIQDEPDNDYGLVLTELRTQLDRERYGNA